MTAPTSSPAPKIAPVSLRKLPELRDMFEYAVKAHFAYFSPEVQRKIIRDHTLLRLALAAVDPRRIVLIARMEGKLVGYAIGAAPKAGSGQMFWLYVDPNSRGANIGLSLLSRMLKLLREKGVGTVHIATHDHRRYYERQGFKPIAKRVIHGVPMDILAFDLNHNG